MDAGDGARGERPELDLGSGPGLAAGPHRTSPHTTGVRTPAGTRLTLRIGCAKKEKDRKCSWHGRSQSAGSCHAEPPVQPREPTVQLKFATARGWGKGEGGEDEGGAEPAAAGGCPVVNVREVRVCPRFLSMKPC